MPFDVDAARCLTMQLFTPGSDQLLHAQTTARRAEQIAAVVGPIDREILLSAAWLHDVGFCPQAHRTGFHPLDGAIWLHEAGWPERVVAMVAHHCEALITARALGLEEEILRFPKQEGPLADALVYADMAAGPDGRRMSLRDRLDDIAARHVDDPPHLAEAWERRRAALIQAAARTEQRMAGMHRHRPRSA